MAVGNFAQVADSVTVEVTSNSGTFTLPAFSLQPGESRTINIRDLLLMKDVKGNPFPPATFGGFRITGKSTASSLIVKEHLLNAALKLATPFYGSAPYVASIAFYYSSYTDSVGGSTVGVSTVDYWSNDTVDDGCPYAYSSNNTGVATVTKNGCVGVLTAVAVGSTTIYAYESDLDDGEGDYGEFDASAAATATSPTPDHVSVLGDQAGYPQACPTTGVWVRQMQMQIVTANGTAYTSNLSISEAYSNLTTNTCGNGQPVASSRATTVNGGEFLETMAVAGSSGNFCGPYSPAITQSSGCGFSLTSTWSACSLGYSNSLWTSTRGTYSNSVAVNGTTTLYTVGAQLH
jgi:hypothetical protein